MNVLDDEWQNHVFPHYDAFHDSDDVDDGPCDTNRLDNGSGANSNDPNT